MKKSRLRFTDDQCADIALARLGGLKGPEHKLLPIEQLAMSLGISLTEQPSARFTIANAIKRAIRMKLVAVDVRKTTKHGKPDQDHQAREDLLDHYPGLQDAVVIRQPQQSSDDEVHRSLGMAMADFIATKSVFQQKSVVGVGSGRGVERTIQALRDYDPLRAQSVMLMSLTGSVYSTPRSTTKSLWYDADGHTKELAKCFQGEDAVGEPTPYLISHPLAYTSARELKKAMSRVWLGAPAQGENAVPKLTHMLVGVGIFTSQPIHRFYKEATVAAKLGEPFLSPIREALRDLKALCDKAVVGLPHGSHYSPVAEMSNLFIFVPPPPGVTIPNEKQIRRLIASINSCLLTVKEHQIRHTQMLVVAGPKRKSHALRALMETRDEKGEHVYPVKYLCTTTDVANDLVSSVLQRRAVVS